MTADPELPTKASEIYREGMKQTVQETAPSLLGRAGPDELEASKLTYTYTKTPRVVPAPNSAEVWQQGYATDHMITVKWTAAGGWETPALVPYGPLSLMPTTSALHYATECFEGMKLYRGNDGRLRLFRPDKNAARMLQSALRVALPAFPPDELKKLVTALATVDGPKWLPADRPATFLYVRPTLIATTPSLAVRKPDEALLFILLSCFPPFDEPGGSLGPAGSQAATNGAARKAGVRLLASEDDTIRAWPGGFGFAKLGANYGPSLLASAKAVEKGYDQILWLFGKEGWVTESGASNFFAVMKDKATGRPQLVTAPLNDQIVLPGVTRISVLDIARERLGDEMDIVERQFTIHELIEAADQGRLLECFASGTAFFISPIGEIHYRGRDVDVPLSEGVSGKYAAQVRTWLRAIMYGDVEHPWGFIIPEKAS